MLSKAGLQRMFGMSFYNQVKGLEKTIKVIRHGKFFCSVKGVISSKELVLPPSSSMPIRDGDIVDDGLNKFVVIYIQNEGQNTVWQMKLERFSEFRYKRRVTKQVITNKISNGNINQNVGSGNDIQNIKNIKDIKNYSIKDIAKIIPKVDIADQKQLLQLETIFNNIKKQKKAPKKGFLKKFDSLLGKYPNVTNIISNLLLQWAETGFIH